MKHILVIMMNPAFDATMTVENFGVGATNRVLSKLVQPAGKGLNAAIVARRFYPAVSLLGLCARQDTPAFIEAAQQEQLACSFVQTEGAVRTNLKVFDPISGITTELNEKGFSVSEGVLAKMRESYLKELSNAQAVVVTGSLPEGVPKDFYFECIRLANERGVKVILDADGEAFSQGVSAVPFAVKPNLFELEQFSKKELSTDEEIAESMQALVDRGISLVALSMGARGAFFMNREALVFAPSPAVSVKSTVGAGDSMVAMLACAIAENKPLEELARLATAAGSATASKQGTELCTADEVHRLSREVAIRHV